MGHHTIKGLSHSERRDRRQEIAAAVTGGKSITDVAIEYGVSFSLVVNACDEFGVSREVRKLGRCTSDGLTRRVMPSTKVTREQWESADWSLRDVDLANVYGVTRERVRQIRNLLGKDRAKFHHKTGKGILVRRWLESVAPSIPATTITGLVEACPVKTSAIFVRQLLAQMGLSPASAKRFDEIITKDTIASFVTVAGDKGCWEWNLSSLPSGYGTISTGNRRHDYAHRFVFQLFNGPLPDGMWCLHDCDNPKCVNPSHLYAGTATDNARDRMVRGRDNCRVLSMEQAVQVRERFGKGEAVKALAAEYGVNLGVIYGIVRGRRYRDYSAAV